MFLWGFFLEMCRGLYGGFGGWFSDTEKFWESDEDIFRGRNIGRTI
jgi:hypothetical protein